MKKLLDGSSNMMIPGFCIYEGSLHITGGYQADLSMLDLYSPMYDHIDNMRQYLSNSQNTKPYILCEFCHAIYLGDAPDGRKKYAYGGDSGEFSHDGNFCVDGLVYPDRTVSPGLLEYKNVLRPVRASVVDPEHGLLRLENKLDFTNTKDFLSLTYQVENKGQLILEGNLEELDIPPHGSCELTLSYPIPEQSVTLLKLTYVQKSDRPFTKAGHILGFDQLLIKEGELLLDASRRIVTTADTAQAKSEDAAPSKKFPEEAALCYQEEECLLTIQGKDFTYTFHKLSGLFYDLRKNG